jgi:hypothetical protein
MFIRSLSTHQVQLTTFGTFESVCAYVQQSGSNAFVVCVYRPGSQAPSELYTDLSDLLESTAAFTSPTVLFGDFNLHLGDTADPNTVKFQDVIEAYGFVQHVKSPTHRCGYLFDLLDNHAPLVSRRFGTRRNAQWFDADCRVAKKATRRLERRYRQHRSADTLAAWHHQFEEQRHLFQDKFVCFWQTTIENSQRNPRKLWRTVNSLLQPPVQTTAASFTATVFAQHFQQIVNSIRNNTANAPPRDIRPRSASALSTFTPGTSEEMKSILSSCPTKSFVLDPLPTWLLK